MNKILEDKISSLESAQEFECWYLVKHSTNFANLCYLVSFLKDYVEHPGVARNIESYISKKVEEISKEKPFLNLSNNYRALRVAAFFGLIKMTSTKYDECIFTDTYNEIVKRCNGVFDDVEKYKDIIIRQVEKMYISSSIDEGKESVRKDFAIYPVMFLNKVLIELGKVTGKYSISMNEYRYLVATTKKYEDYLETMLLIKLLRDEPSANSQLEKMRNKFDNRMNKAIELLDYLDFSNDKITIKDEKISEVSKKVFDFESRAHEMSDNEYIDFLCSTKSLFESNENKLINEQDVDVKELIKRSYLSHTDFDINAENEKYDKFKSIYSKDAISALSGKDLLLRLFAPKDINEDSLIYNLEHNSYYNEFGGIGGGSAFKYPLFFYTKDQTWHKGFKVSYTEDEAIAYAEDLRNQLATLFDKVEELAPFDSLEKYKELETFSYTNPLFSKMWVLKYLHMLYPAYFSTFYAFNGWIVRVLHYLHIKPAGGTIVGNGQISLVANELEIPNVFFAKVIYELMPTINENDNGEQDDDENVDYDNCKRECGGENIILYGVPGAGKSWTIKNEYCSDDSCIERLVFHPDYTYSDFVGQIMPKVSDDGAVSYEFMPGPFTQLVDRAYHDPNKMYYLVIEEINRGNAPAIFGDVFQLLDRQAQYILDDNKKLVENTKYGASEYEITNADVAKIVYGNEHHKVSIPSNMSILCTMNTSDQNVFTLDTAFQRRWSMRLIENKFPEDGSEKDFADTKILDTNVTWEKFFTEINTLILNKNIRMTSSEDKRLGTHFVLPGDLKYDDYSGDNKELIKKANRQNRKFAEKVLKYLWDDAFKFNKDELFDITKVNSLEKVIAEFVSANGDERFDKIFKQNIVDALISKQIDQN